jgi:hypothetical protein
MMPRSFLRDMTDGRGVMFVHLLFVVVVDFTKARLRRSCGLKPD